jgi:deoxyribose-phosphate aldolase
MVGHPAVPARSGKLTAAGAEQGDEKGTHALAMLQRDAAMPDRIAIRANRDLAPYIDHTLLKPGATREELVKLCDEARTYRFAGVCVASQNVALCARLLEGSGIRPISVVGFPSGTEATDAKVAEAREAIGAGAAEIDMVIHLGRLKAKDYAYVERDIRAVVEAAAPRPVKVILETSALDRDEKVIGCALAKAAGAAFVKTSTGFGPGGATAEDVALMRQVVGEELGVKASGGVRTAADARRMLAAGANRLGASASVNIVSGRD